jgi:hypothetical protein
MKFDRRFLPVLPILASTFFVAPQKAAAQPGPASSAPIQTGSAAYPGPEVHHPSRNVDARIGDFDGQSDIGSAKLQGSARYDATGKQYTINSAGYNTTYTREEFRFLWKKMSGDVSIGAKIDFPDSDGYDGRKAVLAIRQDLEDDSKEAIAAVYGTGVFALSQRSREGQPRRDETYQVWGVPAQTRPGRRVIRMPRRIGLEKHGDVFILYVSIEGEPMHAFGAPVILHMDQPFYVGIGFCSNMPDKSDTAVFSSVTVENLPKHPGTPTP